MSFDNDCLDGLPSLEGVVPEPSVYLVQLSEEVISLARETSVQVSVFRRNDRGSSSMLLDFYKSKM